MKTILFACVHNAGRSQIAAAWFNALSDRTGRAGNIVRPACAARCQREK
jgi:protein-tyrosine-phosphatase